MEGERKPVDSGWGVGLFSGAERAPWSPEQLFVCPGMGVGGGGDSGGSRENLYHSEGMTRRGIG